MMMRWRFHFLKILVLLVVVDLLVRRSATICLFSKTDKEMLNAKTGDWYITNPQRGRSNNSVMLIRDEVTREEWAEIMKSVKQVGEPKSIWAV
jgi:ribonucleoside-diphosphate reductase alpha chain